MTWCSSRTLPTTATQTTLLALLVSIIMVLMVLMVTKRRLVTLLLKATILSLPRAEQLKIIQKSSENDAVMILNERMP